VCRSKGYNACNGCPEDQPRATWNEAELEKVYRASIAPALAYPLPQVYFASQAKQWFNVRRYAFERFGDRKPFAGPIVSCRATVDCNFADRTSWQLAQPRQYLSPPQSWQAFYDSLNNSTTPDDSTNKVQQLALPFVTDLMRQTTPATFRRTPRS